jgi:hypothetical protein
MHSLTEVMGLAYGSTTALWPYAAPRWLGTLFCPALKPTLESGFSAARIRLAAHYDKIIEKP